MCKNNQLFPLFSANEHSSDGKAALMLPPQQASPNVSTLAWTMLTAKQREVCD